jgi:uncharacterized membrane protein SirB2
MDLEYSAAKRLHIVLAATTGCLFLLRTYWMMRQPSVLFHRWVKVVPHVVDTLLLGSGVWLALHMNLTGLRGWLPAKLTALLLYIALGMVALKWGRTKTLRVTAAVAALFVLGYIACVAATKSPWGLLAN